MDCMYVYVSYLCNLYYSKPTLPETVLNVKLVSFPSGVGRWVIGLFSVIKKIYRNDNIWFYIYNSKQLHSVNLCLKTE